MYVYRKQGIGQGHDGWDEDQEENLMHDEGAC